MSRDSRQMRTDPVVTAAMLIRRPASEVFEAFVDPDITSKFWFTKSSGRLVPGADVRWDWEMYNASAGVRVVEVVNDRRILIDWGNVGTMTTARRSSGASLRVSMAQPSSRSQRLSTAATRTRSSPVRSAPWEPLRWSCPQSRRCSNATSF